MTDLLTIPQAATILGVTERLLRLRCQSGRIDAKKYGRTWLIDTDAVETFRGRDTKRGPKGPRKPTGDNPDA